MRMLPHRRRTLWTLFRAGQFVRCEAAPHPFGMELRYLVNGKPIVTRIFEDLGALDAAAAAWCDGLVSRGWRRTEDPANVSVPVAS